MRRSASYHGRDLYARKMNDMVATEKREVHEKGPGSQRAVVLIN